MDAVRGADIDVKHGSSPESPRQKRCPGGEPQAIVDQPDQTQQQPHDLDCIPAGPIWTYGCPPSASGRPALSLPPGSMILSPSVERRLNSSKRRTIRRTAGAVPSDAQLDKQRRSDLRYRVCLIATATPRELPPIARTSCLCTGCNGSGRVGLPLVVRSRRLRRDRATLASRTEAVRKRYPSSAPGWGRAV